MADCTVTVDGLPIARARRTLGRFLGTVTGVMVASPTSLVLNGQDGTCVGVLSAPDAVAALCEPESIDRKEFEGNFLLWRRMPGGKLGRMKPAGNPRFRHPTREAAEGEAARLLELFPDSTFVVLQEIGVVKPAKGGGA